MTRAYKTELDPNNKQRTLFVRCCGTARFVYNWALADRKSLYAAGEKISMYEQKRRFNALKDEQFPWIREVPYTVEESAFANCDTAYKNFFRRLKSQPNKAGFPKFKSRKNGLGNFTLRGSIVVEATRIKLPRLGWIRLKENNYLPEVAVSSATVSERAGHWFVSVLADTDTKTTRAAGSGVIGIDLGIKELATCSNGLVFANPKSLKHYGQRLARMQRELSRRQVGSRNRNKTKQKIAKLHYRISNIRRNALHEITSYLVVKAKPKTIVIEDLNVAGMLQNRRLSKAIADASFSEIRRQLEYKCAWYGVDLVVADRFYPSSRTCSACGAKKPLLKLSERTFVCESCGTVIDRDLNAANNLAALVEPRNGRGLPVEGRTESPVKQEPSLGNENCPVGIGLPDYVGNTQNCEGRTELDG